jgi:hypothetical protein
MAAAISAPNAERRAVSDLLHHASSSAKNILLRDLVETPLVIRVVPLPHEGRIAIGTDIVRGTRWTRRHADERRHVDGEVVWYQCRRFEVPKEFAASSFRNFKSQAALADLYLLVPVTFRSSRREGTARVFELRRAGTRYPDADIKLAKR